MQITWQGVTYESGRHIPTSELKEGMVVICGDDGHEASICWRVNGALAPFVLVTHDGNAVVQGLKKLPVGFTDYSDISCHCEDLNHLYEAIVVVTSPMTTTTGAVNITTNSSNPIIQPNKTLMSTIKTTLKNILLSATDKTLRAHGLEDDHGEMTTEAKTLMCEEVQEERWATRRLEIATQLLAEDERVCPHKNK